MMSSSSRRACSAATTSAATRCSSAPRARLSACRASAASVSPPPELAHPAAQLLDLLAHRVAVTRELPHPLVEGGRLVDHARADPSSGERGLDAVEVGAQQADVDHVA